MSRRPLALLTAVVVASFAMTAIAVAYFADSEETYDVVRAGPPIPWLKLWSQGTDPVNLDASSANNLTYATQNNVSPAAPAASGKVDGATVTLTSNLGKRSPGGSGNNWKPSGNPVNTSTHGRFNRLVTVEVPSDIPVAAGQTVSLTLSQENADQELSSSLLMFNSLEFATITAGANTESQSSFRGTAQGATVQLAPGAKRQVNVEMRTFGQTDSTTGRVVNTAVLVALTTPDGDVVNYRVPVTICNHIQQCA